MKTAKPFLAIIWLGAALAASAQSAQQQPAPAQTQQSSSTPLYQVTVVGRTTKAVNYSQNSDATMINFRGTPLLPFSKGQAKVESKKGAVKIHAEVDGLQPASQFGPEYLTYVLWAISPEGHATNLGELAPQGGKGKVDSTAHLQSFAMIVTAEPYFAVIQPSDVVVAENVVRPDTVGSIGEIDAKVELLQRGHYAAAAGSSPASSADPKTPLLLSEARNAVGIAKGTGADRYAADTLTKAQQSLNEAEAYHSRKADKKQVEMAAREAVQTAEDARAITVKRLDEERLAAERQAAADREAKAKAAALEAEKARLEAQLAEEREARQRAEAEAAKAKAVEQQRTAEAAQAKAVEQQRTAEAAAQKALEDADRAAREKTAADAAKAAALADAQRAQRDADLAKQDADVAKRDADRAQLAAAEADRQRRQAEADKAELRARLLDQLNRVLQTRDSMRGLIVNMSDVLFDTGSYTLKPGAREKLAKVSGIVLAYPGLKLQVEGHTDSVGGDEFNQRLSEQRAGGVRDFLVLQGVSAGVVTARGFGKMQPVAVNDTAEGRQQNRRVEIVVSGEAIDVSKGAAAR